MTDSEVLGLIRGALNEVAPTRAADFEKVGLETKIDELALDSIAIMEMVGSIEDKCETTFEEAELAKVQKIADLAKLVRGARA